MNQIGRNTLCPCGSGKKYKKCCFLRVIPTVRTEKEIFLNILHSIQLFFEKKHYDLMPDAYEEFWGKFDPNESMNEDEQSFSDTNFSTWLLIDYSVNELEYESLVDSYLKKKKKKLDDDELKMLTMLEKSFVSLYEVKDVRPDEWVLLKDLLFGKEFFMNEKEATHFLEKGEIFAARLLKLDGTFFMAAETYPYEKTLKKSIISFIEDGYEFFQEEEPGATLKDFLKQNSNIFNYLWYSSVFPQPEPKTLNITKHIATTTQTKSDKVPKKMLAIFDAITKLTDDFCNEKLTEEYAQLARFATAALCRKRPSPLLHGRTNSWACGIVYALGYVNFLFSQEEEPYINATDLCDGFSVTKNTGYAKSKAVRDALKLTQLHPGWCLESLMDDNPYTWLIKINGFIVDARSLSREKQEILLKKGLIPYIPDEK